MNRSRHKHTAGASNAVRLVSAAVVGACLASAARSATVTVTFRQGLNSYDKSSVAQIRPLTATSLNAAAFTLKNSTKQRALLLFENIFGSEPGQIPLNATITSATVTMRRASTVGSTYQVAMYRNLTAYDPTIVTYESYCSPDAHPVAGTHYLAVEDDSHSPTATNTTYDFGVTGTLQAWLATPASNYGWYVSNTTGSSDNTWHGITASTEAYRPTLTVVFTVPPAGTVVTLR